VSLLAVGCELSKTITHIHTYTHTHTHTATSRTTLLNAPIMLLTRRLVDGPDGHSFVGLGQFGSGVQVRVRCEAALPHVAFQGPHKPQDAHVPGRAGL
jgi:hypothetical protein